MSLRSLPVLAALACTALLAAACSDEVPPPAAQTPSASPAPAKTPSPTPGLTEPAFLEGVEVAPPIKGEPMEFPADLALVLETGCTQCSGPPTTGIARVYRDPTGATRTDTLLDPRALGLGPREVSTPGGIESHDPEITGFAANPNASEIVASICVKETCGDGLLNPWSVDSQSALLRSTDGGITWSEIGRSSPSAFVVALIDSRIVVGYRAEEGAPISFAYYPGWEPLAPPDPAAWPLAGHPGELLWSVQQEGKIWRNSGSIFVDLGPGSSATWLTSAGTPQLSSSVLSWYWQPGGPPAEFYLTTLDDALTPVAAYSSREYLSRGVGWQASVISTVWSELAIPPGAMPQRELPATEVPAIIDLESATVHAFVRLFDDPNFPIGRNHPVAVQTGPFGRVVNTGSCLNIRESPATSARVLECAADGVLLTLPDVPGSVPPDGVSTEGWLEVISPSGTRGWAATQYLEH